MIIYLIFDIVIVIVESDLKHVSVLIWLIATLLSFSILDFWSSPSVIKIAFIFSIHFFDVSTKLLSPYWFLIPSKSMGLKSGLFNFSHIPKNSIVFLFLNQFWIIWSALLSSLYFAISVIEIKSSLSIFLIPTSNKVNTCHSPFD